MNMVFSKMVAGQGWVRIVLTEEEILNAAKAVARINSSILESITKEELEKCVVSDSKKVGDAVFEDIRAIFKKSSLALFSVLDSLASEKAAEMENADREDCIGVNDTMKKENITRVPLD